MTRLERVLDLLTKYDNLVIHALSDDPCKLFVPEALEELREEKEKLTKELTEHGCRRRD